jgi:hypothetical protein
MRFGVYIGPMHPGDIDGTTACTSRLSPMQASFRAMYASYARWGQPGERYDLGFDELKDERILVGSPQEVAERVVQYRDEFDVPVEGQQPGRGATGELPGRTILSADAQESLAGAGGGRAIRSCRLRVRGSSRQRLRRMSRSPSNIVTAAPVDV